MSATTDLRQLVAGLIRLAGSRPGDALTQAELILGQFPRLVPVRCLAASLARRSGDLDRARAHLDAALAEDPGAAPALAEMGALALIRGEYTEAAGFYRRMLDADHGQPDLWFNLALAEERRGRFEEAAEAYRAALGANASNPAEVHARLGGVLSAVGNEDAARVEFDTALALDEGCVEAHLGLGMASLSAGRFENADLRFRRCVELRPDSAEAWKHILESRKLNDPDDADLAAVRKLVARRDLPEEARESLGFALGKACDDLGLHDEAFEHYRQANELKRRRLPAFDRSALEQQTRDLLNSTGPAASCTKRRPAKTTPVFIVGAPRSGTTLVDQILTAHPDATGVGELAFFDALVPGDEDAQRTAYLDRLSSTGARVVTNKYPANIRHRPRIRRLFPEARIVHVVRAPLDTCLSIYFQDFPAGNLYANDLEDIAAYYRSYRALAEAWAGRGSGVLELHYEKLLEDMDGVAHRLLAYCGLRWDASCLDFASNPRPVTTLSRWQVRQPIYSSSVGKWRRYRDHLGPLIRALAADEELPD
jgi:tetratricopeptide (TPR) repeat protein